MMKRVAVAFAIFAAASGPAAHAQRIAAPLSGMTSDPTKFDVGGVRLYMTPDQVRNALHAKYDVDKARLVLEPAIPGIPHERWLHYAAADHSMRLAIQFVRTPSMSSDDEMTALYIQYGWADPTKAEEDALIQAALDKYGPPTFGQKGVFFYMWCGRTELGLDRFGRPGTLRCAKGPVLSMRPYIMLLPPGMLQSGGLVLTDDLAIAEADEDWKHAATPPPRPNF